MAKNLMATHAHRGTRSDTFQMVAVSNVRAVEIKKEKRKKEKVKIKSIQTTLLIACLFLEILKDVKIN
ncbi:hypothetical protein [Photorhabdus australis]|uniref:hypothetical protein n=1 Tax=Photorhabdus australis TaxID=286156 RepID=UPI000816476F|nr:hypothetical protein [Photorhabdus australis]